MKSMVHLVDWRQLVVLLVVECKELEVDILLADLFVDKKVKMVVMDRMDD